MGSFTKTLNRCNFSSRIPMYIALFNLAPLSRNVRAPLPRWAKHPQTITPDECFTVLAVYRGLSGDAPGGRRTTVGVQSCCRKLLSSVNKTHFHSSTPQPLYRLQNSRRAFRIFSVSCGFLIGFLAGMPNFFPSRSRMVFKLMLSHIGVKLALIERAVINGFFMTSLRIAKSVRLEVHG